jgi:hypothetical protein
MMLSSQEEKKNQIEQDVKVVVSKTTDILVNRPAQSTLKWEP